MDTQAADRVHHQFSHQINLQFLHIDQPIYIRYNLGGTMMKLEINFEEG